MSTISYFKRTEVPLPRLEEQRAITAALSDMDELIGASDKLIAKKRAIKLATVQQLLTGKTGECGDSRSKAHRIRSEFSVSASENSMIALKASSVIGFR